ncbi:multiple sugar transport system permease protein [Diaminobutyricimonas aerilata]|uniref:Multiple sugar transport system permease protein n=1 Tax=Diaminobutyricimonas aerilata TaxID=1162967 RepID=A0A2M9CG41_9MICO|nr:carbohydrate ABC transporter permease [Diaminobutyricimonas aerilata]PJJ70847.1 multiple sugar transport system permease protein [Diaminobutyricimonas aerilata]
MSTTAIARRTAHPNSTGTRTSRIVRFVALGAWLIFTLFPLYWIAVTAFKPRSDIYKFPLEYWPSTFSIENFVGLFEKANFGVYLVNSIVVATVAAILVTLISLLSGYIIARFEFRGKGAIIMAFLVTQMIPAFIALGPLYQLMVDLGLVNQRTGLVIVYIAMCIPFSTIMLRGFFENVPDALEEAAMIDGCSRLTALFRVLVPVMAPGIIAAFIFNFVSCWNELFLSVTLMTSDANKTVPTALNGFITSYNIDWGSMSAAAVLTVLPTMVLFAFASKYIVQGLTSGAVKG